jgi:hypothetical protein
MSDRTRTLTVTLRRKLEPESAVVDAIRMLREVEKVTPGDADHRQEAASVDFSRRVGELVVDIIHAASYGLPDDAASEFLATCRAAREVWRQKRGWYYV